jgi:fatty-acyl-CoA synthase
VENKEISESSLINEVRNRLAGYKLPKKIIFTDTVERAPNGKANYKWARKFAEDALA